MTAANTTHQVEALLQARRIPEAARLLTTVAKAGEPEALMQLAYWCISGDVLPRDLSAARKLLRRAAEKGRTDAALLHTYFLASGTGGPSDWARARQNLRKLAASSPDVARQVPLLESMKVNRDGSPARVPEPRTLSTSPHAVAFEGFMTPAECAYLRELGEPRFQPSVVIDPHTGNLVAHPVRRSSGTFFGVFNEDLVVNAINRRIAAASNTKSAQGEPLQLLRYGPGNEYRAHMDAIASEPNQRVLTMLVYLRDDYEGGETHFLRTGLAYKGRTGDALLFRNVTEDGRPDPMAEHAGRPVTRGIKIIASRWIRAQPFVFPPPQPLLPGFRI